MHQPLPNPQSRVILNIILWEYNSLFTLIYRKTRQTGLTRPWPAGLREIPWLFPCVRRRGPHARTYTTCACGQLRYKKTQWASAIHYSPALLLYFEVRIIVIITVFCSYNLDRRRTAYRLKVGSQCDATQGVALRRVAFVLTLVATQR